MFNGLILVVAETDAQKAAAAQPARDLLPTLVERVLALATTHGATTTVIAHALELFTTLESQLPTRRFFHAVLCDSLFLSRFPTGLPAPIPELFSILKSTIQHPVDEQTGAFMAPDSVQRQTFKRVEALRMLAFAVHESEELKELSMVDIGRLVLPGQLAGLLAKVPEDELRSFAGALGVRTEEAGGMEMPKEIVVEGIVERWGAVEQETQDAGWWPDEVGSFLPVVSKQDGDSRFE